MPTKPLRKKRNSGKYDLQTLQRQSFGEWFLLCCGCWSKENQIINSRQAMLDWYRANHNAFDGLKSNQDGFALGHRPGERHVGWWFTVGFPEFGPRLVTNPEQVEQRLSRIFDGHLVPSHSFCEGSDELIANWKAGRMPSEDELREHNVFTVPKRDFPNGLETSADYLERHGLLKFEETELLNAEPVS